MKYAGLPKNCRAGCTILNKGEREFYMMRATMCISTISKSGFCLAEKGEPEEALGENMKGSHVLILKLILALIWRALLVTVVEGAGNTGANPQRANIIPNSNSGSKIYIPIKMPGKLTSNSLKPVFPHVTGIATI